MMVDSPFSHRLNSAKQRSVEFNPANSERSSLMTESQTVENNSEELMQLREELQKTREQLVYYASNHSVLDRKSKILTEKLVSATNELVDKDVTIELLQEQISMLQRQNETQVIYPSEG